MRKLMLPALAACALLAASAPVTVAKAPKAHSATKLSTTIGKLSGSIKALKKGVKNLEDTNAGQTASINGVDARVTQVVADLTALSNTVTAVVSSATAALSAINAALTNSTTGLVGLNLARPQFGAFDAAGVILGGTGQVTGASGPKTNAVKGGSVPDIDGLYVVDFGNDVSKRMYTVNVFPYVPASIGGGGTTPTGEALNCSASLTASGVCGAVQGVASDSSPNHLLVQIGDGSSGGAANGFSVTAISG